MNIQCPFCRAAEPKIARVHDEYIWDCCGDLPEFIEQRDPNGLTGLLNTSFNRAKALEDWQVSAAWAEIKSLNPLSNGEAFKLRKAI